MRLTPLASSVLVALLFSLGCASPPEPRPSVDAAVRADASNDARTVDVAVTTDVTDVTDGAAPRCVSDRDCSAAGRVCDAAAGVCVECNAASDCGATQACVAHRCVVRTACVSSRTCPGQVCSARLGYCVDCEADVDCTNGQVCRDNVCVAPPRACRSSRECSDLGLVCAAVRGQCVECVADTDCATDRYCATDLTCRARACTPNASHCVSPSRVSVWVA